MNFMARLVNRFNQIHHRQSVSADSMRVFDQMCNYRVEFVRHVKQQSSRLLITATYRDSFADIILLQRSVRKFAFRLFERLQYVLAGAQLIGANVGTTKMGVI